MQSQPLRRHFVLVKFEPSKSQLTVGWGVEIAVLGMRSFGSSRN